MLIFVSKSWGVFASWCFWVGGCCFRFVYRLMIVGLVGFELSGGLFGLGVGCCRGLFWVVFSGLIVVC